jgi:hypothetical protein
VFGNSVAFYPWAGSRIQDTLILYAKAAGLKAFSDTLSITYEGIGIKDVQAHWQQIDSGVFTEEALLACCASLERDRFDKFVSPSLLGRAFLDEALDIEGAKHQALINAQDETTSTLL